MTSRTTRLKALTAALYSWRIFSFCNQQYEQLFLLTLAPIWLPHWPAWMCTISRIFA